MKYISKKALLMMFAVMGLMSLVRNTAFPTVINSFVYKLDLTDVDQTIQGTQNFARLGYSVASAGDVNADGYFDVIVGVPYFDNGNTDEGVAFLYYGSNKGLDLDNFVLLECNQSSARMGTSVSKAGDVNKDGFEDIIVGAPLYNNGQFFETGAAFLYYGSASGIISNSYSLLSGHQTGAHAGSTVSSAADINGDGFDDFIFSAPDFDFPNYDEGIVVVCYGSANEISTTELDTIFGNQSGAWMGYALSSAGDINNDGFYDIIIGVPNFDSGQDNAGMALVYYGTLQGINETNFTSLEGDQEEGHFGWSVSHAKANGDVFNDIAIGAPGLNSKGAVFLYEGSANGISVEGQLLTQAEQYNAELGTSLAEIDINGDNYSDLIIGSPRLNEEGAVFICMGSSTGLNGALTNVRLGEQLYARYGAAVSAAGDINGDSYHDFIVGAPLNGASDQGAAFVIYGKPDDPLPVRLMSFYGKKAEGHIKLTWQTSQETNSDRFEILRSSNGKRWVNVGVVKTVGTGNNLITYSFDDLHPNSGVNLYKLKMIDNDGTFSYSRIVSTPEQSDSGYVVKVNPNPVNGVLEINSENSKYITLSTSSGIVLYRRAVQNHKELIDMAQLDAGIYLLLVEYIDGSKAVRKIIKR